jgi:hypothetical protein
MKRNVLLFITAALFCSNGLFAQDIITLKNGEEIKAKVQELGLDNVKYKKYENQAGPTYTLMKSNIFMIKYENGDKDVFTAPSVQQPTVSRQTEQPTQTKQTDEYAQIRNVIKNTSVPLRKKMYEIGIKLDGGGGKLYLSDSEGEYNDENDAGFMGGGGIFCDIYPNKTSIWLLGAGLSYWGHYYMTDYNASYSFSYLNWDLYWGARDPLKVTGINLYAKVGLRLSSLTGGTVSFSDGAEVEAKSFYNSTVFGLMTEWGYAMKHFDIGLHGFWMLTNPIKSNAVIGGDISSGMWGIIFTCAYRFSF